MKSVVSDDVSRAASFEVEVATVHKLTVVVKREKAESEDVLPLLISSTWMKNW